MIFLRFYWARVKSRKSCIFFNEFWWNGNVQIATVCLGDLKGKNWKWKQLWSCFVFKYLYLFIYFSAPMSKCQKNNPTNPEPTPKTARKTSIKQTSQITVIFQRFFFLHINFLLFEIHWICYLHIRGRSQTTFMYKMR